MVGKQCCPRGRIRVSEDGEFGLYCRLIEGLATKEGVCKSRAERKLDSCGKLLIWVAGNVCKISGRAKRPIHTLGKMGMAYLGNGASARLIRVTPSCGTSQGKTARWVRRAGPVHPWRSNAVRVDVCLSAIAVAEARSKARIPRTTFSLRT